MHSPVDRKNARSAGYYVTVYKDTDLIFQALKAGACGYILKRFRPDEIIQAISEARAGGAPMTSEIARMVVRSFRAPSVAPSAGLTQRFDHPRGDTPHTARGRLSNKEIAQKANITAGTVRIHWRISSRTSRSLPH